MTRQMKLIGFLQAQNCSNYPASWRHPSSRPDWFSREYARRSAGRWSGENSIWHSSTIGLRCRIASATISGRRSATVCGLRSWTPLPSRWRWDLRPRYLGIGVTYSTTYYEPFHVARVFATMDLLLNGRAAWNVVTSLNDSEAANFGAAEHLGHDLRYDRADEFMNVVLGHWDTWESDAVVFDRENSVFADPSRVHRLDHQGKFFNSRGPFTVPRSPQGHPVIIQAGQSGRGKEFASRWGELIFVIYPNLDVGKKQYAAMKRSIAAQGRDISIAPAVYPIVAETQAEAEDRYALIDGLAKPINSLALLSEVLNSIFQRSRWMKRSARTNCRRSAACRQSAIASSS